MKWRFVDRITLFEPWKRIEGRKCVSLEEYSLLKRFGRKGTIPATIVLEACVDHARWLVMRSSEFRLGMVLAAVEEVVFAREVGMSDVLSVQVACSSLEVGPRAGTRIALEPSCWAQGELVMRGRCEGELVELAGLLEVDDVRALWKELHGAA